MRKIKLSQWAKNNNVCYRTAWNYFKAGKFEGKSEVSDKGSIFVFEEEVKDKNLEIKEVSEQILSLSLKLSKLV